MIYITTYLFIGLLVLAFADWTIRKYLPEEEWYTNKQRLVVSLGWPIHAIAFIVGFIIGIYKKK
jgi:hypothetical protein